MCRFVSIDDSRKLNVTVSTNGLKQEISPQVPCTRLALIDYSFFSNDLIINQYNNTITVGSTTYTIPVGNYDLTPSLFAIQLATTTGLTVSYNINNGYITIVSPLAVTITIPSTAKKLYGWNTTSKTGTTFVSDYPITFSNSDYYYINIAECSTDEVRIPNNDVYSYKITNRSQPGSVLYHILPEPLPSIQVKNNKLTSITITVLDSNYNPVPTNGTNWYFYFITIP